MGAVVAVVVDGATVVLGAVAAVVGTTRVELGAGLVVDAAVLEAMVELVVVDCVCDVDPAQAEQTTATSKIGHRSIR